MNDYILHIWGMMYIAFYNQPLKSLGIVIVIVLSIAFAISYIRVIVLENKIGKIYDDIDRKIKALRSQAIPLEFIDGQINNLKDELLPEVQRLERKRKNILDKLPWLKK